MVQDHSRRPCVGVLYCGDLGAMLGRSLRDAGLRVVTTCEGRSVQTQKRAAAAGLEILSTLDDLVATAEIVVSVVLPSAAESVARRCADRSHLATPNCIFVEANSLDLEVLHSIQGVFKPTHFRVVDAAVHGGAARLQEMGVLYVSGVHADELQSLFRPAIRVLSLGEEIGQATRMKLLMAAQSKCLNLLFLQVAVVAYKAGMLDQFLIECRNFYPEIMTAIERMLPTYPSHAARRITEMQSIENFARSVDAPHEIIHSARDLLDRVAGEWSVALQPTAPLDIPTVVTLAAAARPPYIEEKRDEL